jgi:hypothetical protein
MKRFIFSILCVSVFFIGVGALVERTGARFKSDEKALELVRKARVAIGGDSAIAGVQSMRIVGQTTRTIKIDGADRTEQGETEIAMQLPDKLMKMVKIGGDGHGVSGEKIINKQVDVVVVGNAKEKHKVIVNGEGTGTGSDGKKIVIKKDDGTVEELDGSGAEKVIVRRADGGNKVWTDKDGQTVNIDDKHVFVRGAGGDHARIKHNEMLRLTLGLLLTAPQGIAVEYTFGGEDDVDGTLCNIVVASFGGQAFKLYLNRSTNLPVMMSYTGMQMPKVFTFKTDASKTGDKDTMIFKHKTDGDGEKVTEFQVRFSDYRSTGGLQLPYKWTQTVGGAADETFDATTYEINPANIAEKFQNQKVMVRTKKPSDN